MLRACKLKFAGYQGKSPLYRAARSIKADPFKSAFSRLPVSVTSLRFQSAASLREINCD